MQNQKFLHSSISESQTNAYTSNTQKVSILDIIDIHICESNSILPPARCDVPWALAAQIGSLFLSLPTFLLAICNYVEQPGYVRRVEGLDPWQNVATSNSPHCKLGITNFL